VAKRGRPKGSKNKPKPGQVKVTMFDPDTFTEDENEGMVEEGPLPSPEEAAAAVGTTLDIYNRLPQYIARAQRFLRHERELEEYIQENALVLMQMERDQAVLIPVTRSDISAALKSRQNFVQKATDLMLLIKENRQKRIDEVEARNELLARGGEMPATDEEEQ
jgi:hypothetical protein